MGVLSMMPTCGHGIFTLIVSLSLAILVFSNPLPQSPSPKILTTSRMIHSEKQLIGRGTCGANYNGCIYRGTIDYCCPTNLRCIAPVGNPPQLLCCTDTTCNIWQYPLAAKPGPISTPTTTTTTSYYTPKPTTTSSYTRSTTASYSYSYSYASSSSSSYSYTSPSTSTTSSTSRTTSTPIPSTEEELKSTTDPTPKKGLSESDKIALGVGVPSAVGAIVAVYMCVTRNRSR